MKVNILTSTSCKTDGTPPPYFRRPQPDTVATFPVKSAPSGGIQIGTERREINLIQFNYEFCQRSRAKPTRKFTCRKQYPRNIKWGIEQQQ